MLAASLVVILLVLFLSPKLFSAKSPKVTVPPTSTVSVPIVTPECLFCVTSNASTYVPITELVVFSSPWSS